MHLFSSKDPYPGKIVSVKKINGPSAVGDVCEIVVDHGGKMPYYEGQSYGVIPPGINPKNSRPYLNRLYSISSTRYGDDMKVSPAVFVQFQTAIVTLLSSLITGQHRHVLCSPGSVL